MPNFYTKCGAPASKLFYIERFLKPDGPPALVFLICPVIDLVSLACAMPISLRGAILCFFKMSREIKAFAESRDETLDPLEEPKEHLSHPITLCFLQ